MSDLKEISSKQLDNESESRHTKKTYISFGMYQLTWTIVGSANGLFLFYYYHTVVGLEPLLIFTATAILTFWYAFNDPIIGYLTDRNFKWTRKWGRRFPFIILGGIPWCFSLILIYSAPEVSVSPWPTFFWFLGVNALYETLITLTDVNVGSLRVDKFRTEKERRKYSSYFAPLDMLALVFGMVIPPLLLGLAPGNASYTVMALLVGLIGFVFFLLFIPGAREDKIIIDRYYSGEYESMNFRKGIIKILKEKSFVSFWIHYATFMVATTILTAMVVYLTTFVLQTSSDMMTVLLAIFLTGTLISVPIWLKVLKKLNNNKKVYLIGSSLLCITLIPLSFFQGLIDLAIFMFIVGMAMGCIWTLGIPVMLSSVMDQFVVNTGKNQKGFLMGAWGLLSVFTAFLDELIMSVVFTMTGFEAGLETYAELVSSGANVDLVLWGIRLLVGVIPMLIVLVGTIIFWKIFPLTQEKILENKMKLKELGF